MKFFSTLVFIFLAFCGGLYLGDRLNDSSHRLAAEQRMMESRHDSDLREVREYRAEMDFDAPRHAAHAVKMNVRRIGK